MRIIILGCGASGGVPLITGQWGKCDPSHPKNRRRRSSILINCDGKIILIDASPDLREQLIDAKIKQIDAVLFTHHHADHIRGIDDLRYIASSQKASIPIYGDEQTLNILQRDYSYAIQQENNLYPPFLTPHIFDDEELRVAGIPITPFRQHHGDMISWGFRIKDFAYSTDFNHLPESSLSSLEGLKCWVVGCLRFHPHPSHSHFDHTLSLIEKIRPLQAILTHMNFEMDYEDLKEKLTQKISPAFDGMIIDLDHSPIFINDDPPVL